MAKLKKVFKQSYLLHLMRHPDSLTGNEPTNKNMLKNLIKGGTSKTVETPSNKD